MKQFIAKFGNQIESNIFNKVKSKETTQEFNFSNKYPAKKGQNMKRQMRIAGYNYY